MELLNSLVFTVLIIGELNFTGIDFLQEFSRNDYDPSFPFENVSELFTSSDLVIAHLEGPLTGREWPETKSGKYWKFKQLPVFAKGMADSGIGVALLANNHIFDVGDPGIKDTIRYLDKHSILHVKSPYQVPLRIKTKGTSYIELWNIDISSNPGEHPWAIPRLEFIKILEKWNLEAANNENIRMVFVNSHGESRNRMKGFAKKLLDQGVAWVIFNGDHEPGEIESHHKGKILYGLGNFIFGCNCTRARKGKALRLHINNNSVSNIEEIDLVVGTEVNGFRASIEKR